MSSLAENYVSALYNRYSKMRVLDNYNDTIQFCPSDQFNVPMEYAFHQILSVKRTTTKMREMNVVKSCVEIIRR